MTELEIQALSQQREGLLIEVGRLIVASGFTLQRQRLAQDPHGTLLTMIVRGPSRKQRALESALGDFDRIISYEVAPFVQGETRPHFAATRAPSGYVAPPAPAPEPEPVAPVAAPKAAIAPPAPRDATTPRESILPRSFDQVSEIRLKAEAPAASPAPAPARPSSPPAFVKPEPEPETEFQFLAGPPARPSAPAPSVEVVPFVEVIALEPDVKAVARLLADLDDAYPQIVPHVLALDRAVEEGARESSLSLAGRRVGAWVYQRDHGGEPPLALREAIEMVGVPALAELVEVQQQGEQLHIRDSPLCTEEGHSGCKFFSGYLEGVLSAATGARSLSIFEVGCRSWGAGECVLAVSV
jgi:predicted hydrocarbon binding protein